MGNYLASLRVPPPTPAELEEERRQPNYYDWTVPKWQPFRLPQDCQSLEHQGQPKLQEQQQQQQSVSCLKPKQDGQTPKQPADSGFVAKGIDSTEVKEKLWAAKKISNSATQTVSSAVVKVQTEKPKGTMTKTMPLAKPIGKTEDGWKKSWKTDRSGCHRRIRACCLLAG